MRLQACPQIVKAENLTPGSLNLADISAVAAGHVYQAMAEITIDTDQHHVSRLNGIGEAGFHGCAAGTTYRDDEFVVSLPGVSQQILYFVHKSYERGIEMPHLPHSQGL